MRIAVTGAGGQLGAELCRRLGTDGVPLDHAALDITDADAVARVLNESRPEAVINAAAYTRVDQAEQEPERCGAVNADAVALMADVCRSLDCPLVEISTDYVFGGATGRSSPWREDDAPSAVGVYAKSKLAGEQRAAEFEKHYIVRTCGLYGHPYKPLAATNFVETMLRLGSERDELSVVDDQHCTPSYVAHVARAILFLIETGRFGIYHVTNTGATTWYELAAEIFRQAGMTVRLKRISTEEYGAPAPRPGYSVLDTSKYESLGGPPLPHWKEALGEYLAWRAGHV